MSVAVSNADGVMVFTLTSDPNSPWSPLCQILNGLCCSPACCCISQHLKKIQRTSQSVLGTLHIMDGLLNIGLGAILICSGPGSSWTMDSNGYPFWLGGLFILFGITCILSEKLPSLCLVILNVILNIIGVAMAIAAIVLYSLNLSQMYLWWICHENYWNDSGNKQSLDGKMLEQCEEAVAMIRAMLLGINSLLIVLSALELCVAISSAVMGIMALCGIVDKSTDNPEVIAPLLVEPTGAPQV